MNLVQLPFLPSKKILTLPALAPATKAALRGAFGGFEAVHGEPEIRRIVDLSAGVGAFAAYAMLRWPYAWIDCYEEDEDLRRVLALNVPPGARVFAERPRGSLPSCDLLRVEGPLNMFELWLDGVNIFVHETFDENEELSTDWLRRSGFRLIAGEVLEVGHQWRTWVRLKEQA